MNNSKIENNINEAITCLNLVERFHLDEEMKEKFGNELRKVIDDLENLLEKIIK